MTASNDVDLVNQACARIGEEPIQSFSDDTLGARAAKLSYQPTIRFMLGLYAFSFARQTVKLTKISNPTIENGFRSAFQLPAERRGPPIGLSDDPTCEFRLTRYALEGDKLFADLDEAWAVIKIDPHPLTWSDTFSECAVVAVAGKLVMALRNNSEERDRLTIMAFGQPDMNFRGGLMGAAIAEDAQATPARRLGHGPFVSAWMS